MDYISGVYRVTDKQKIIDYFNDIDFILTDNDKMILDNQYELNESGDIFINGVWMKTSVYNELWLNNSKLIEKKYVYPYIQRLRGSTGGMYVNKQTVFSNKKFVGDPHSITALHKSRKKIVSRLNRNIEECI